MAAFSSSPSASASGCGIKREIRVQNVVKLVMLLLLGMSTGINKTHVHGQLQSDTPIPTLKLALIFPVSEMVNHVRDQPLAVDADISQVALAVAAVEHVNSRNGSILPGLAELKCDIRLEYEILDSVRDFTHTLNQYFHLKEKKGIPDMIVGPSRSTVTVPLSFVSATDRVPTIGYSATGEALDEKSSHPYFLRTIPSDASLTVEVAKFFQLYEWESVAMVYVEDTYGRNYKDGLFKACEELQIDLRLFPFVLNDKSSIKSALEAVRDSQLNIKMAVVFEDDLTTMMEIANDLGLTGEGKLWIFSDSIGSRSTLDKLALEEGENFINAMNGSLQMRSTGRVEGSEALARAETVYSQLGLQQALEKMLPGGSLSMDYLVDAGVPVKTPFHIRETFFEDVPFDDFGLFAYDAVITAAYAAERACVNVTERGRIALFESLKSDDLSFEGITGTVIFDKETGSRDTKTATYVANSIVFIQDEKGNTETLQWRSGVFDNINEQWVFNDRLRFPPGDSIQVPTFTDVPTVEENLISKTARTIVIIVATLIVILVSFFVFWTFWNRDLPVMRASQPIYLVFIGIGLIISTCSTYFPGWDQRHLSAEALSILCNAFVWFLSIGLTITTLGFIAKLYIIIRVFKHAERNSSCSSRRQKRSNNIVILVIVSVILMNILLLSLWTALSPLAFKRVPISFDDFGQVTEAESECHTSEDKALMVVVVVFHILQYVAGAVLTCKARLIPGDFQESKGITISFFIQIQLIILATPVILAIEGQDPTTNYCVIALLIFLINTTIAIILFGPKIYRVKYGKSEVSIRVSQSKNYRLERTESGLGTRTNDLESENQNGYNSMELVANGQSKHHSMSLRGDHAQVTVA